MKLEEFNSIEEYERARYTGTLAARILGNVRDFYPDLTQEALELVICEYLYTAARDVRAGGTARIEYIGDIRRAQDGTLTIDFDHWISAPLKEDAA